MNRLLMDTVIATAAGSIDINTTAEIAEVYSSVTDLRDYDGMMIRALDSGNKNCWGILTNSQGPSGSGWVSVESLPDLDDDTFDTVETGFTEGNLTSLTVVITRHPYREMEGHIIKEQIRTPFEGGYVQSRPKFTRSREKFSPQWRFTSSADFDSMCDFFKENQGGMFFMSHPVTNYVLIARFSDDELVWRPLSPNVTSVSIAIEEV